MKYIFILYKTPKELILLNNAFHNMQKLRDEIVSFAIFSQTFAKGEFFCKTLSYFLPFHMFAKHDQFGKQQTVFNVS